MGFKIEYTDEVKDDIKDVINYISNVLYSYQSAEKLYLKILKLVEPLSRSPEMYVKVLKKDELESDYRRIPIDNYVLLYTVNYDEKTVYISRFYYGKSNYREFI